ncbi:MAG: hypothetical protein WD625_06175, partial [Balneolales bacterium]
TNLQALFTPDSGKQMRFLDISFSDNGSTINVLFSHFLNDETNGDYILKKYNRSDLTSIEYPIINHGYDTYMTYFGGAYFVKNDQGDWNNTIFLARNESDIWTVEEWLFNGSFSKVREIDSLPAGSEGLSLTRPEPPINSEQGGLRIIYQKGDYDESYTTWTNEIIGISATEITETMEIFNRLNAVPTSLTNKTFALVKDGNFFRWYVGDGNNLPVPALEKPPVQNTYTTLQEMYDDQANQTKDYFQQVTISGVKSTFQYLGTTSTDKSEDYEPLGEAKPTQETGTVVNLNSRLGGTLNMAIPDAALSYTTANLVSEGHRSCFVNAASEPVVYETDGTTPATKISGATFTANTNMEMVVESKDGTNVRYF